MRESCFLYTSKIFCNIIRNDLAFSVILLFEQKKKKLLYFEYLSVKSFTYFSLETEWNMHWWVGRPRGN